MPAKTTEIETLSVGMFIIAIETTLKRVSN